MLTIEFVNWMRWSMAVLRKKFINPSTNYRYCVFSRVRKNEKGIKYSDGVRNEQKTT